MNADFSSTRVALGMARVRHKTRSPVTIKRSKACLSLVSYRPLAHVTAEVSPRGAASRAPRV